MNLRNATQKNHPDFEAMLLEEIRTQQAYSLYNLGLADNRAAARRWRIVANVFAWLAVAVVVLAALCSAF